MDKKLYRTVAYAVAIMAGASYSNIALAATDNVDAAMTAATLSEVAVPEITPVVPPVNSETPDKPQSGSELTASPTPANEGGTVAVPAESSELTSTSAPTSDSSLGTSIGETNPKLTPQQEENRPEDQVTAEWAKKRPEEKMIEEYIKAQEGLTVVDIEIDGATETTVAAAKAALTMHAGDTFTAANLAVDRDNIYNTGYFYDLFPTFERVPEGVVIVYHVLENPVLKDIRITGNTVESTETLEKLITLQKGEILNGRTLQENIQAIQEKYRSDGYILAKITDLNIERDGVLSIKISEGILEGYSVKGNTKTKDKVILREMRQKPGEPFNATTARRSMQRVYNLGFFEDVNVRMNPGVEPNAVIMEIEVKEKRTGSFGIGAGYSSADGVLGMVSISDTNFLGMGDSISISYEKSGDESDAQGYTFSYRRPWLDSKETAATLRLYNRTYEYDDYDADGNLKESYMRKYSGVEMTLSRPHSEYSTNFLTFKNRKDHYKSHTESGNAGDRSTPAYADWRSKNFGLTRSLTFEHVTDTRDNIYEPTSGSRASLAVEVAGFGGDFDFQKYTISDTHYFKAGRSQVFALRTQYGYGTGTISEFNQYRIGGQDTIRGYREDQFRGDRMALASLEYRFPIISKVQGALFTDWGAAWDSGFTPKNGHGSIGFGIGINTPIGPLRLDYGYGSQGGRVHFRVGGMF